MVEVVYNGNLGNRLFQYCFGRIIAESLGFCLKAAPLEGFPHTGIPVEGENHSSGPVQELKWNEIDLEAVLRDKSKRKITFNEGYFQRYEYYKAHKAVIRGDWLVNTIACEHEPRKEGDCVVVVRQGDYKRTKSCLPFSYYEAALEMAKPRRVFLCTDDPRDPFIRRFRTYNAVVRPPGSLDNFKYIMSFDTIITCQSTFSWWAAFLSNAGRIYGALPLEGFHVPGNPFFPGIDLRVDDEPRYTYIACKERYSETPVEMAINFKRRLGRAALRELEKRGRFYFPK